MPELRLLGVVQIGEAVGEAGTEMQQGRGRRALHAVVAVGGAGHHALEQAEHAAHALDPVERGDEMHLRGAGIGEADIHAARDQRPHQTFRTVHRSAPVPTFFSSRQRSTIAWPVRQRISGRIWLPSHGGWISANIGVGGQLSRESGKMSRLTRPRLAKSGELWPVSQLKSILRGK